jgi:hypothetical protein
MSTSFTTEGRPVVDSLGANAVLAEAAAEIAAGAGGRRLSRLLAERADMLDLAEARRVTIETRRSVVLAQHSQGPALALRWFAPGQPTAIHDHGTWGALLVLEGEERYERYQRGIADEAVLQATHYLRAGDTLWWSAPPGDLHLQEGGRVGALDLILLGGDPDRAPTTQYCSVQASGEAADLVAAVHTAYRTGDVTPIAAWYDDDVLVDICVPAWRFQVTGRDQVVELAREEFRLQDYRVTLFRSLPTADGAVVETEVRFFEDGAEGCLRELHVLRLQRGHIVEQLSYSSGHWDAEAIRRQAQEAPMVRP